MDFGQFRELGEWLSMLWKNNDKSIFSFGAVLMWNGWKAKCKSLMCGDPFIPESIINRASAQFVEIANPEETEHTVTTGPVSNLPTSWMPPSTTQIKINFDGASNDLQSGIGVVFRNHKGEFYLGRVVNVPRNHPEVLEAMAVREGLLLAVNEGIRLIWIEGDAQQIVKFLLDQSLEVPWRLHHVLADCRKLRLEFDQFHISFIHPTGNSVAHCMAKHACTISRPNTWYVFPPFLLPVLLKDLTQ
ncbi:PREDICTED: uncharacterized protein LOC109114935 [Nelumbo nucifera]|uniref:Uncharacterized protein LOC109114935 n=1 Tax=Nelumbo nucifera TaxID=4432 RepID=A0A1U8Q5R6_NELNU|nr:PREDICTED: uncharacterized protein LOC109114935 [Nelumbo nucifera]